MQENTEKRPLNAKMLTLLIAVLLLIGCEPTGTYYVPPIDRIGVTDIEHRIYRLESRAREDKIGEMFPDMASKGY